jgi:hypothetical protein
MRKHSLKQNIGGADKLLVSLTLIQEPLDCLFG